jgi:predicted porin
MKKTVLAALLPAMLVAGVAQAATVYQGEDGSNVDVYGRLGFNISDKGSEDTQGNFDGRFALGGSQTVNDKVSVIGWAEYQVGAAEYANSLNPDSSDLTARYVWAGIDASEYGKITGGRVASGLIMLTDIADVFAASDVAIARQVDQVDATATQVFRQDGTLQYQNSFDALDVSVAYILGNGTSDLDAAYNTALRYTFDFGNAGKLAPVVAYQYNKGNDGDKYTFWGAGTRYYVGDLMLGAMYSEDEVKRNGSSVKSTDEVYELTAVYDLNADWVLRAGYRSLDNKDGDDLDLKDTTLEAQYKLTDRSSIFTSYVFRGGDNGQSKGFSGDASEDFYHLGLRYEF